MVSVWRKEVCFLLVFFIESFALYEDQVGKFDWKISFVGKIKYSKVDLDPKFQRVYIASESNVVAALSLKQGKILWRRLLEKDAFGEVKELFVGNEIVTISGNGPYMVRGWNKTTGLQSFEWTTLLPHPKDAHWTIDQNKVYQVRVLNNVLEVTAYHLRSGSPAGSTKSITATWISAEPECVVANGGVTCHSSKGSLTFLNLTDSTTKTGPTDFDIKSIEPLDHGCLLKLKTGAVKAAVFNSQGVLLVEDVPLGAVASTAKLGNSHYLNIAAVINGKYELRSVELDSKRTKEYTASHTYPFSLPSSSSSSCATTSSYEVHCFVLVSSRDHALSLMLKGKVLWVREEALANVVNVEMIDLPVSEEEAAIEKEFANKGSGILEMVIRRLSSQILQVKNILITLLGLKESDLPGVRKDLVRDPFGLHKLILVVTSPLKVFGMDNEKGEIIWQFHLQDVTPFNYLETDNVPLFIQRTSRHLPHPTMATLLLKKKETDESVLYTFNPITGEPLDSGFHLLNKNIAQCLLLHQSTEDFIHGLVLLYETGQVEVFPKHAMSIAMENARTLFVYTVNSTTSTVTGYTFLPYSSKELKSISVWSTNLPGKVIAVVPKRRGEKVHSQGRVLGDRSVLYKYINPNLVAIATQSADAVHKSIISLFLIDTVNGKIIFSIVHKRATEPVHIVHSENWVVYSFFNDKSRRTEIVTLDLYEGKSQRNTTAFSSLDPPLEPLIGRQAYIFPHYISTMKETITEKGITSKHVLVGLSTGGVMEVPWALLDPRRAVTPTAEMREEGVLPYIPELALPPETIITYNHTLIKISGIHTSPAGLESTSLVFIYGLDLFYTRVSPSKTFDVLKDDFEYWLITAVLTGLITAAYVTKRLASRKALKQAWK